MEMPKIGTPLHNWQQNQLSNTYGSCLNAKIWKEIAENEGSTIWSEWRVKLSDLVVQKNCAKIGNAWEKKYAEFESYDGMPERERYIIGDRISQAMELLVRMPRFGRSLQRMKGVPNGVSGE